MRPRARWGQGVPGPGTKNFRHSDAITGPSLTTSLLPIHSCFYSSPVHLLGSLSPRNMNGHTEGQTTLLTESSWPQVASAVGQGTSLGSLVQPRDLPWVQPRLPLLSMKKEMAGIGSGSRGDRAPVSQGRAALWVTVSTWAGRLSPSLGWNALAPLRPLATAPGPTLWNSPFRDCLIGSHHPFDYRLRTAGPVRSLRHGSFPVERPSPLCRPPPQRLSVVRLLSC